MLFLNWYQVHHFLINKSSEDDNGCEMLNTSQNEWRQEHPIKSNSDITVDEPFDNPSFNLRFVYDFWVRQ